MLKQMKVLHINTQQNGGAALCALRINNALIKKGVECKMLFAEGDLMPEGIEGDIAKPDKIVSIRSYWLFNKIRNLMMHMPWYMNVKKMQNRLDEANIDRLYLHQPLSNFTNIANHPLVKWADVVHLHWVSGFVDYPSFFRKVNKPIVWTLHDKYPAIGVQHYCSEHSHIPKNLQKIDAEVRVIKRKGVLKSKNLNIVAISETMQKICAESEVLKGFPITLIHNGVNTKIFKKCDVIRTEVLSQFTTFGKGEVTDSTNLFMFSAYNIWDENKGLDRTLKSLELVKQKTNRDVALLVVGNAYDIDKFANIPYPIIVTDLVRNQHMLAQLYSICDFFILSSYEETFPQTPLEAMACGTPVISTPCSGASDLIRDFNGWICNGFDIDAITDGILNCVKQKSSNYKNEVIRQHIIDNYEYSKIADLYITLYKSILNT